MKSRPWTALLLLIFLCFAACSKKQFVFSGKEDETQAFEKCMGLSEKKRFQEAIDCLEIYKSRFPDSRQASDAELRIADAYFQKKEYLLAAETYKLYAKLHPTSEKLDYVYYRIGLCYLNETPQKVDRDQEHLPESTDHFAIVLTQFPNSPYAKMAKYKYDESRRLVARRHFYVGRFYYRWGEYKAAIPRFQEVYERFPDLGLDEDALYYAIKAYRKLHKNEEAKATYELMKAKFPEGKKTKSAAKEVAKS